MHSDRIALVQLVERLHLLVKPADHLRTIRAGVISKINRQNERLFIAAGTAVNFEYIAPYCHIAAFNIYLRHLYGAALRGISVKRNHGTRLKRQIVRIEGKARRRRNDCTVLRLLFRLLRRGWRIPDRLGSHLFNCFLIQRAVRRDLEHAVEYNPHLAPEFLTYDRGKLLRAMDAFKEFLPAMRQIDAQRFIN